MDMVKEYMNFAFGHRSYTIPLLAPASTSKVITQSTFIILLPFV